MSHFSANQLKFIEWLALPKPDRHPPTQELLADELGLNRRTLTRWRKLPELRQAVTERARELLGDDLSQIYGALRREATKGQFQHIKLALELTGEYTDQRTLTLKVEKEIDGILDILESTLEADDYDRVLAALSHGPGGPETPEAESE